MAPTKAIVISTHTLTEVPAMCHRAVLVDRGRIVADDTPEGLARRSDEGTLESAFARLTDQVEEETL
jgi:ABC-2 type transport system ATP-binding protein